MATEPAAQTNRTLSIALIVAIVALAVALLGVSLVAFVPGIRERLGLARVEPTAEATATALPTATAERPTPTPEVPAATATPVPTRVDEELYSGLLAQAEALALRSKVEEAVSVYRYLIRLAPGDARAYVDLAEALVYDAQPGQALGYARLAAELDPGSAAAAAALSRAQADSDASMAVAQAQEAVRLDPLSAAVRVALAEAYRAAGRYTEAATQAQRALALDPDSADARSTLAWVYVMDDELEQAVDELQSAAALQPELWLRWHELGAMLLESQTYQAAIDSLGRALELRPKGITYAALGQTYYESGQYDQAAVALHQAINRQSASAMSYGLLAITYARLSRCDDARAASAQALAEEPAQTMALEANRLCQGAGPSPTPRAAASATPRPPQPGAALAGRIAFPVWNAQAAAYDVYLARAEDGSGRRLVATEMHQPALSPRGDWLAVNGERENYRALCLVKPDGSSLAEITPYLEDGQPAWSPDGSRLAMGTFRHGDKQSRIYILDDVPFLGGKPEGRPLNYGPDDVRGQMPAWTTDNRIVFRGCHPGSAREQCQGTGLFIVSAEPGPHTPEQLTGFPDDTSPAVFGDRIAFMSSRDGDWEVYVVNLDGSGLAQLTDNDLQDGLPAWSADGRSLAFVSNQGGSWAIWAMGTDDSGRRKLFDIGGGGLAADWTQERISWGP